MGAIKIFCRFQGLVGEDGAVTSGGGVDLNNVSGTTRRGNSFVGTL